MSNAPNPLSAADQDLLITTKQAADLLGVSPRSLEKWRLIGCGPAYRKLAGRLVRYALADLDDFAGDRRISTSDPGRDAGNPRQAT